MKTIVIYHKADFDGIFCREIARKHLSHIPTGVEFIGWDYGDPVPVIPDDINSIFMLDISVDGLMDDKRLCWIDHHKSAMEKYSPDIPGYRIDGVAACRLAWQFFNQYTGYLPKLEDYKNRNVLEPRSVNLAGEYDIWDKRNPDADIFQHGLRSQVLTVEDWRDLLSADSMLIYGLIKNGRVIQFVKQNENDSIIKDYGFTVVFEGITFLACNHARFNSHLFTAGIKPPHEALLGFNWSGKDWRFSLYGIDNRTTHDLSQIAVKYGGGGHRNACGFRLKAIPDWEIITNV